MNHITKVIKSEEDCTDYSVECAICGWNSSKIWAKSKIEAIREAKKAHDASHNHYLKHKPTKRY